MSESSLARIAMKVRRGRTMAYEGGLRPDFQRCRTHIGLESVASWAGVAQVFSLSSILTYPHIVPHGPYSGGGHGCRELGKPGG